MLTSPLAAVPAGDLVGWTWLTDQLMQVYLLCILFAALAALFLFLVKHKIGLSIAIVVAIVISFIPAGIAASGVAAVKATAVSIANAIHLGG